MKFIVGLGIAAALVVFAVNWGEVLMVQLVIRSVLVGLGFVLAWTAARKAIATFVFESGSPAPESPPGGGTSASAPPENTEAGTGETNFQDPGQSGSDQEEPPAPESEEEMDPGQIAEMISGQMSEEE